MSTTQLVQLEQGDKVGQCYNCGGYVREENIQEPATIMADPLCEHCNNPLADVKTLPEDREVPVSEFVG